MIGEAYGLRFARVQAPAWTDDVAVFDVTREGGAPVGKLYFDLYARRGKTPGAGSSIPMVPRTFGGDPSATSAVAIVTSFDRPSGAAPALLTLDDLIMLLHETGHALHMMELAGQSALFEREFDFFDVPSQVMEAWAYRPEFLRRVARHHATGSPMPAELEAALVRDQPFRAWYQARRTTVLANVDVRFHGDAPPEDPRASYAQSFELAQPYAFDTETHPEASLYIPIVVYSGNGHALVWGEAIAIDLLGKIEEEGFFDRKVWARYTADVLASDAPAEERIAKFLGRRWSTERMRAGMGRLFSGVR
jgi:Zn-dependent oligopeptidase